MPHQLDQDIFQMLFAPSASGSDRSTAAREILREAERHYDDRADYRIRRRRARDFYAGRQWEQLIKDPLDETGALISEADAIKRQNRLPLVMNMVSNVINNIDGQFRQNRSERMAFAVDRDDEEAVRMLNLARRAVRRYNSSPMLEADGFREHVLSGASASKATYTWDHRRDRYEIVRHAVDQTRLFYNLDILDRRLEGLSGLRIIGQTHDISVYKLIQEFAQSPGEAEGLRNIYGMRYGLPASGLHGGERPGFTRADGHNFLTAVDHSLARVIETWMPVYMWQRTAFDPLGEIMDGFGVLRMDDDEAMAENERRAEAGLPLLELDEARYEPVWHYVFLSPHGDILKAAPTPYHHGEHPYTVGLALLVDGETWGIVDNIIDAQRWLNRLLSNIDHMMGAGSKGAPAVDKTFLTDSGVSVGEINAWFTSFNTTLVLDVPPGKTMEDFLHIYQAQTLPPGYFEMVPLLVDFLGRIPGVTEALQGQAPSPGTPASSLQQQIMQSATNVALYVQTYFDALRLHDRKENQLIVQSFGAREMRDDISKASVTFDRERVEQIDTDVAMGDVTDTATMRLFYEQDAQRWLEQGYFGPPSPETLLLYLEAASNHPRSQEVAQRLREALSGGQQQQQDLGPGGDGAGVAIGSPDLQGALAAAALQAGVSPN